MYVLHDNHNFPCSHHAQSCHVMQLSIRCRTAKAEGCATKVTTGWSEFVRANANNYNVILGVQWIVSYCVLPVATRVQLIK